MRFHAISFPPCGPQRALLEQKQRRKRQEPLMVQPNTEVRPRRSRTRRGEEQAPLVESQLNITNDVIMDGEKKKTCCLLFLCCIACKTTQTQSFSLIPVFA